jgi:hypothetical protein
MSTIQEIEAAIPQLRREEVEALRAWIEDYLEVQRRLGEHPEALGHGPETRRRGMADHLISGAGSSV